MRVTEDTIKWSRANLNQMRYAISYTFEVGPAASSLSTLPSLALIFLNEQQKIRVFIAANLIFLLYRYWLFYTTTYSSLKGTFLIGELIISKWWNGATWCDPEGAAFWLAGAAELVSWSIQSFLAARKRRMLNQTKPTNILQYSLLGS